MSRLLVSTYLFSMLAQVCVGSSFSALASASAYLGCSDWFRSWSRALCLADDDVAQIAQPSTPDASSGGSKSARRF